MPLPGVHAKGGRHTVNNNVVDLGEMTIPVKTLHDYAANLSAGSGNIEKAFNRQTVIAMKGLIRAAFPLISFIEFFIGGSGRMKARKSSLLLCHVLEFLL